MTSPSNRALMQKRAAWEKEYQAGRWDYLSGGEESMRYAGIASILRRRPGPVSLLDIGCGEGLMLNYVEPDSISKYTGLDLAQAALDRINPPRPVDRLVCSSVEEFEPNEKWDVILFNEVLYYTFDPVAQIKRYERALAPDGLIITSIFLKPKLFAYNNRCARRVQKYFEQSGHVIEEAAEISKLQKKLRWQLFAVKPTRREDR